MVVRGAWHAMSVGLNMFFQCEKHNLVVVTWISPRLSATSHRTPSDLNLELGQRISS